MKLHNHYTKPSIAECIAAGESETLSQTVPDDRRPANKYF